MQTERAIGELKTSQEHIGNSVRQQGEKLDRLNDVVVAAQGSLKTLIWVGSIAGVAGVALLGEMLKLLGDHFSHGH